MKVGSKEHFLEELKRFGERLYNNSFKSYNQTIENFGVSEFVFDFGNCKFEFHYGDIFFNFGENAIIVISENE